MPGQPPWTQRFRHPTIEQVTWAPRAPDRLAAVTTEDGGTQAWAWDLGTGERRRASEGGVGAEEVHILPDGSAVVWWYDELGDERGRWMATPFEGGPPAPLLPDVPDGWTMGISLVERGNGVGIATDDDYRIFVSLGGEPAREVYRSELPAGVGREWPQGGGGLSPDAALVCIRHAEHGDIERQALRVLDARTGTPLGEQVDPGMRMEAVAWAPGDGHRLAFTQERTGIERPAIWDLDAGRRVDVEVRDREGPVIPIGWVPDERILAHHDPGGGTNRLLAVDPASGTADELVVVEGTIHDAAYRPDGTLWIRSDSSVDPPAVRDADGGRLLELPASATPPGTRTRWISWTNPSGDTIHGFLTAPAGAGPHPTIASIHGGPGWHHTDLWDPAVQAFVDEGFAVLQVNYRGSTGRGRAFREALQGNIGFPETEDVVAGIDHVVAEGVADPGALFLEGWSWGGYLTTLIAGLHPDRWRGACAGIPVGDYVAAHYECAPALRAWDLATLGGSPMDLPELYRERNPMTYVDRVRAPMLLIAGEHDSRCPLGQVMVYAHALRARDREVDVHLYPSGHHAMEVEERIAHTGMTIGFFRRQMSGSTDPDR
jgi:dipeptidyl aminopeptidase/acylaminoacyl peptidase